MFCLYLAVLCSWISTIKQGAPKATLKTLAPSQREFSLVAEQ